MNYSTQEVSYTTPDSASPWASNVFSAALVLLAFFIIYVLNRAPKRISSPSRRKIQNMGIAVITPKGVRPARKKQ